MCGGFVEAGICETMDKAESDCDSEVTLLPISMSSRYLTYTTLVHSTTKYNCQVNRVNLVSVCVCVCLHYLNIH